MASVIAYLGANARKDTHGIYGSGFRGYEICVTVGVGPNCRTFSRKFPVGSGEAVRVVSLGPMALTQRAQSHTIRGYGNSLRIHVTAPMSLG